ncbi:hypothetical protein CP877_10975 [Cutibacterium modestum]|nr:hypothetical protein CP877_10975 [Cutibacterium modestum]
MTHTAPDSAAVPEQWRVSSPWVAPIRSTGRRAVSSRARSPMEGSAGAVTLDVLDSRVMEHDRALSGPVPSSPMSLLTNTTCPCDNGGDF